MSQSKDKYFVTDHPSPPNLKMFLTVVPPVCVAKYSTTKTPEHIQTHTQKDRQPGTLKPNSVNAVEFKNVKVGVLRKEIPPKPLNMQSFGHQTFISSQPYLCL